MTIRARKRSFCGRKLCFVGDGNNMANSLIVGGIKTGMEVSIACPAAYRPDAQIMQWASQNGTFTCTESVEKRPRARTWCIPTCGRPWPGGGEPAAHGGVRGLPGQQRAHARRKARCNGADCLPAHRGEEITEEVLEAHAQEIFDEAENRLHAQKAVLVRLMS